MNKLEKVLELKKKINSDDMSEIYRYNTTNSYSWHYFLAPKDTNIDHANINQLLERNLHAIIEYGGKEEDIRSILGACRFDDLDELQLRNDDYEPIDLGYCVDGLLVSIERFHEREQEKQINNLKEAVVPFWTMMDMMELEEEQNDERER